jgi:hypothetical protein
MSDTPKTDALVINILGVELASKDLINLCREMERQLNVKRSTKLGRPRIPLDIQKQIAETPHSISSAHLAKTFRIANSTVSRYRKVVK